MYNMQAVFIEEETSLCIVVTVLLFGYQLLYPGVAQLVGRLIWVQDAGSSNLPTRTKKG